MRQFIVGEDISKYLEEVSRDSAIVANTTETFVAPKLTTAERDTVSPVASGMVIFNTTTGVLNFHNGTAWGAV